MTGETMDGSDDGRHRHAIEQVRAQWNPEVSTTVSRRNFLPSAIAPAARARFDPAMSPADGLITINCGSSSIKAKIFAGAGLEPIATMAVEDIGQSDSRWRQQHFLDGSSIEEQRVPIADHQAGFEVLLRGMQRLRPQAAAAAIAHRVVHGGEHLRSPVVLDDAVANAIDRLAPFAPLHNPYNLLGIRLARAAFPQAIQVAVFDTAFHQSLPPVAYRYAVPDDLYRHHGVRRYGFHGLSHQYVSSVVASHLGRPIAQLNLITLHLGNGASAAAIQAGRCVDTSMGMTPLEGLVMGSRSGDLDPAVPLYLIRHLGRDADQVDALLNSESGLLGLCGTGDMRDVEAKAKAGDERAELALTLFCYRVRKYVGAFLAVLGRVDAIAFTGGIGENSTEVRRRVCEPLATFGIELDLKLNLRPERPVGTIHRDGAPVAVAVVQTDEELEMARQTLRLLDAAVPRAPSAG